MMSSSKGPSVTRVARLHVAAGPSSFDWKKLEFAAQAASFALGNVNRARGAGDGKGTAHGLVAALKDFVNVADELDLPQLKSHVKILLRHLEEKARSTPSVPKGRVDSTTHHALDLVDHAIDTKNPRLFVLTLAGVVGVLRMEAIRAQLTGPFDPLGEAFQQAEKVLTHYGRALPRSTP